MANTIHTRLFGLIFFLVSLLEQNVSACAVCMGGASQGVLDTYLWMTLALSIIPIGATITGIYIYKKHHKKLEKVAEHD